MNLPVRMMEWADMNLPDRMEQFGSHWMNFYDNSYLSIFQKSVKKIQVLLKFDRKNGDFTLRPIYVYDHILLSSS